MSNTIHRALVQGTIFEELGTPVDCYVLEGGRRVISQRGVLRALQGKSGGGEGAVLGRFLARLPKRFEHLAVVAEIEFSLPSGGTATGREAQFLVDLCDAYADAFLAGELHHTQERLAKGAISLIRSFAKIGLEAIIDEATGYQRSRAERELAKRFNAYLRDDVGRWEMRFPPTLVVALAPLYGLSYVTGSYPRGLQTPFAMIYNMVFGREVADEMRRRNPNPDAVCHHQVLKDPGHHMLTDELAVVTLLAKQSRTKAEFWRRMRNHYLGEPFQFSFEPNT